MCLQRLIKLVFLLVIGSSLYGQSDSIVKIQSPYRTEYNPWFKFSVLQRGFESDSLTMHLDDLEKIPRKAWSRTDSLNFAQTTLQTGNIDLSKFYFHHLNVDFNKERNYWWSEMMIFVLEKDYESAFENIHKNRLGILQYSKIYFFDRILLGYIAESDDSKWHKTHSILNWEVDSTLLSLDRKSEEYKNNIIRPLENLEFVLKLLIHYIHEEDPVLAQACYEMGLILENHVSLTQAYIAYSLARHYNKWDKGILGQVKQVKGKLSEKKYKIPIFRRYFPRTEYWRFDYGVLKQKIIYEKNDTIPKFAPILMVEQDEFELPFPSELIIIGGILLMFILVLVFLKPKKK